MRTQKEANNSSTKSIYRVNDGDQYACIVYLPGVPGRFLFFLAAGLGLGLGLGFGFCSWCTNPPVEEGIEKGSPGNICILRCPKKKRKETCVFFFRAVNWFAKEQISR